MPLYHCTWQLGALHEVMSQSSNGEEYSRDGPEGDPRLFLSPLSPLDIAREARLSLCRMCLAAPWRHPMCGCSAAVAYGSPR